MSTKKKVLFGEDQNDHEEGDLKINPEFARRFEHNKRRELLDKAKAQDLLDSEDDSEGSVEEEDDDGALINANVEKKFLETIAMIRSNDPKLKAVEGEVFRDEDFEDDSNEGAGIANAVKGKDKKLTYKDQIREDVLKRGAGEDSGESDSEEELFNNRNYQETVMEEERRLKKEFKIAADAEDSDDGFILKKTKEESDDEVESIPDDIENLKPEKVLKVAQKKAKKELKMETDTDLLKRFYGDENKLDSTDKFLRNYILLQCWKDNGTKTSKVQEQIDREDEERDAEMEDYEQKYNFRFEEGTGAYITTHQREIEDTMRRKDDSRKDKRLEKKERHEEEKRRKQEEINQLKQIKKDEILEKLKKAEFVAGNKLTQGANKHLVEKIEKELKTDFIPELYDRAMEKMFDDKYYTTEDKAAEKLVHAKDIDMKLMKDEELESQNDEHEPHQSGSEQEEDNDEVREQYEREIAKSIKKQVNKKIEQEEPLGNFETWFVCDGCQKPIDGGEYRFDCNTCENFCYCERCYKRNKEHLHKFNRQKVPYTNKPPKNSKNLIAQAYMLCHSCGECLLEQSKSVFTCNTCNKDFNTGEILYFCLKCKKTEGSHEHKLQKLKAVPGESAELANTDKDNMNEEEKKGYLDSILDEYYKLDFEDLIGGGQIKTRFKYSKVAQEDFGLTEDEILLLDDRALNKLVSLKKYRPYIDAKGPVNEDTHREVSAGLKRKHQEITDKVNVHRVMHLKKNLQDELRDKRKLLKQSLLQNLEQEKEKYFKGQSSIQTMTAEKAELISKNKRRKEKQRRKEAGEEEEDPVEAAIQEELEQGEIDEAAAKKRRRLALYGVKQ